MNACSSPVGIAPGLCSVTFRELAVEEVAHLAAETGLRALEWAGDAHVPPGDELAIARAARAAAAAGVTTASYGSYLLADGDAAPTTITRVLDTAVALGAPNVRVWTPFGVEPGAERASEVVQAVALVAREAGARGLTVGLEFHGGTLTATAASTTALLDAVDAPNLATYWQPPYWRAAQPPAADAIEAASLAPRLSHLHVYEWTGATDRRPLAEGAARWRAVFDAVGPVGAAGPRVAFIEFVAGDDPAVLRADARTLHDLLGTAA
jgi:sugar phosphate isomerase/epimerase